MIRASLLWALSSCEVVLGTVDLDLHEVMAEGGSKEWTGEDLMPLGENKRLPGSSSCC